MKETVRKVQNNLFYFYLLNIQGLTNSKMVEVEELMKKQECLVILTETQKKIQNVKISGNIAIIDSMRDPVDKKGGGLMLLHNMNKQIQLEKRNLENKDLMFVQGSIYGKKVNIIVVYFSTGIEKVENKERNIRIRKEAEKILNSIGDECTIVLGDFNGHVGFKGPQKLDKNGKIILDWLENFDLIMLNDDIDCEGLITWQRNEQKSVVDFVLVNKSMYNLYIDMKIDENKDIFDLSDHNMIRVSIKIKACTTKFQDNLLEETEYYKFDEESLCKYVTELEKATLLDKPNNISSFNKLIKEAADKTLKAKYRRRKNKEETEVEPPWINEDIRKGIKLRQKFNRQKRNASTEEEKARAEEQYQQQKTLVQKQIKTSITEYEENKTNMIRDSKDKGKYLWRYIKILKNINKNNCKEEQKLFDENGNELKGMQAEEALINFWTKIYQCHKNDISEVWNEVTRKQYVEKFKNETEGIGQCHINKLFLTSRLHEQGQPLKIQRIKETLKFPKAMKDHIDTIGKIENKIEKMEKPKLTTQELEKILKKMKNKKSAGPDGLKPELYKALLKSKICLSTLTECFNKILGRDEDLPEEWKVSKTVMLPKVKKPQAKELRPIALTNVSYKVFMTFVKNILEKHIERNGLTNEAQSGFTDKGRVENNIFILNYCIERSKAEKKPFFLTSVDYSKAYDSIKRGNLAETLMDNNSHEDIISIIAEIYEGDKTLINYGEIKNVEIGVTSGIKQGCTGSTTLFKLITYKILERMEEVRGFVDETFKLAALFFADDGLILANSIEDARRNVEILTRISRKYGLEINKDKSNSIIFGMKNKPIEISGIKVVNEIKYLGVTINSGRDCFKRHKELMLEKAQRLANQTYPIIAKSCNKVMIGKVYWKSVALPHILYGANVIEFSKTDILKLQRIENKVYRQILGAPAYSQVSALRGEIGASSMTSRIMEGKIKLLKHTMTSEDSLLGRVTTEMKGLPKAKWTKNLCSYLKRTNIQYNRLRELSKDEIHKSINQWDTLEWRKELNEKSSLEVYFNWKNKIGGMDKVYDNTPSSVLLYKARTNVLPLNDRKRWANEDTKCKACGEEMENLKHFLLHCPKYNEIRITIPELQQPFQNNESDVIGRFLFESEMEVCKMKLKQMWKIRQICENNT